MMRGDGKFLREVFDDFPKISDHFPNVVDLLVGHTNVSEDVYGKFSLIQH